MRKLIWLAVIALVAGGGYAGFQYAKQFVAEKVMDQVVEQVLQDTEVRKLLEDPEVLQAIQEAAATENLEQISRQLRASAAGSGSGQSAADGASGETGAADSGQAEVPLVVKNVDEAQSLVLDKFSIGEIREYAAMAGGGLTPEEKAVLKDEVLGKFSEEEQHALKVIALLEAQKRLNG